MSTTPTITTAERPSRCPDCYAFIKPGDQITRYGVFDEWRHVRCPKSKFDITPGDVCPVCFMVRAVNGACACPA